MKKVILLFSIFFVFIVHSQEISGIKDNPFLKESNLTYGAPDFSKIRDYHYKSAFDYGLRVQREEIQKIADNTEKPTFENTVLALEKSGEVLKRVQSLFFNITGVNNDYRIQQILQEYAPIFAKQQDDIFMNEKIYKKLKSVKTRGLDAEDLRLLSYYKTNFEMAGAFLNNQKKERLKNINAELASLSTQYQNKLIRAQRKAGVLVDNISELEGLSKEEIAKAANDAKNASHSGKYLLVLSETTQQNYLKNLKNRKLREKIYNASRYRAERKDENDTRETLERIAKLRLQKARLLGKKTYANWKLQNQMAQKPERALAVLEQLSKPAIEKAKQERQEIQNYIDRENGGFKVEPWDWAYYSDKLKSEKFAVSENEARNYFELQNVLHKGAFYSAEKYYGLTFKERKDLPIYHSDVSVYEVFDNNGTSIALYYLDLYSRSSKADGAWMSNFAEQSHLFNQKPIVLNVFNFPKPIAGKPTLLGFDDVRKLFHEFGHALNGIFANQKYASLSGTNTPKDFVEFPSQFNEFLALTPEVLNNYALHYKTGKPIDAHLLDDLKSAANFNSGYKMTELLSAATLDLKWHSVKKERHLLSTEDFENAFMKKYGFSKSDVPMRYYSPYFSHIWGEGYSAGYYAYVWSDILSHSAWEFVKNNGGMNKTNGERFKKHILSVGNAVDLNRTFQNFTGKEPDIRPLMRNKGFVR